MSKIHLKIYLEQQRKRVNEAIHRYLPRPEGPAAPVIEAMHYSIAAGGKRVRPILMMAGCQAVGGQPEKIMPAACAMECVHTYSLIHDDLPAMDNDDLRRGKPTCHKVFGEAMAILAGDGLLTLAFELMAHPDLSSAASHLRQVEATRVFAKAAGHAGMVGGQTADILNENTEITPERRNFIHSRKTGALIRAAVEMGAILGGGTKKQIDALASYGEALGLCFQVIDDILDVVGDETKLGKPVGSDERNRKSTYPALFGIEEARRRAEELRDMAVTTLQDFGHEAEPLRALACYIVDRDR